MFIANQEQSLFNLIVSGSEWPKASDSFISGRVFEYTSSDLISVFKRDGQLDTDKVLNIPTLFVSETNYNNTQPPARIGRLTRVRSSTGEYRLDYYFDPETPPIPNSELESFAQRLGIEIFEFQRTHWAIKEADLFETIFKLKDSKAYEPKIFQLNKIGIEKGLVAAMMPFESKYDSVYQAIKGASELAGMHAKRADDIWENEHIIQDIVSLIERAEIVVCDLTNRNANVFYELGIAHSLGKQVVMITQSATDVPFDVRHLRYLQYYPNSEGLNSLTTSLATRFTSFEST